jgi:organic radical activating enzyme
MNKIIPIRIDRSNESHNTRLIEWRLSNVCNYDCSFCSPQFKDGSKKFLEFDTYATVVRRLISQDPSKNVWIQFTGGEPTLYPRLIELLSLIKECGGYTSMISNGSRTARWWRELADAKVLDRLFLTHHPEQGAKASHTIEINNIMQSTNTLVSIFVTAQANQDLFKSAIIDYNIILGAGNAICSLKPMSSESILQPYLPSQLKLIQNNLQKRSSDMSLLNAKKEYLSTVPWYYSPTRVTYSDGSVHEGYAQEFVTKLETRFDGWECDIGKDMLILEIDQVFRGVCRVGGKISSIYEEFNWMTDSVICDRVECNCSIDFAEPKRKI